MSSWPPVRSTVLYRIALHHTVPYGNTVLSFSWISVGVEIEWSESSRVKSNGVVTIRLDSIRFNDSELFRCTHDGATYGRHYSAGIEETGTVFLSTVSHRTVPYHTILPSPCDNHLLRRLCRSRWGKRRRQLEWR